MVLQSQPAIPGLTVLYTPEKPPSTVTTRRMTLSGTFRSLKKPTPRSNTFPNLSKSSDSPVQLSVPSVSTPNSKSSRLWSAYLILSTNDPIKTYLGVTSDFARRLKQHNGELKGGAKSSRSGRPWICACIISGFRSQSEACSFESKWKGLSKKLSRRKAEYDLPDTRSLALLRHREAALKRVKDVFDCNHLEIDWKLSLS
ncbi:hypothetical protein SAY87_032225 [Trapa incisa]|uniref:GIY-YIG domain-containing protein n=1 Tax=Trapa incisa TaxID=236973 RepID=A0AAN7QP94_9MYRT|nr:hypothetical protein SAY87_032225 [Trapa incisa]